MQHPPSALPEDNESVDLAEQESSAYQSDHSGLIPLQTPISKPVHPSKDHGFEFRGQTMEYFRIWIVNLALTILTLGIFSAWAKVRSQRWFYGNTWVAGAPFEYLAQPIPILKGRIIAFTCLGIYVLAGQFLPLAQPFLLIVIGLASPWLIVNGLRFRARYSAWRTLNFRFTGDVADAFKYFVLMFGLIIPTLGLILPYIKFLQTRYVVEDHRFGGHRFKFGASGGNYYGIYLIGWLIGGALLLGAMVLMGVVVAPLMKGSSTEQVEIIIYSTIASIYFLIFLTWVFIAARVTNLFFNQSTLSEHSFKSTLRARDLIGIYLSNTLAILLSAGMLVPWAKVRMARYRAKHMRLIECGSLLTLRAESRIGQGAAGAETAEVFEVDLSL